MLFEVIEKSDDLAVVALSGRLDTVGVDEVEAKFNAAITGKHRHAIVDMSKVEFLASMAIRMLVIAGKTLARRERMMVIVNPSEVADGVLADAGLYPAIRKAETLEDARALVGQS